MFAPDLLSQAETLLALCRSKRLRLVAAESCTGGLIAALLTTIAGSSDVFERGFVTYSNDAKVESLGVDAGLIARCGAVSAETAAAMAEGALMHARADLAIAVTGIAGPGGGSALKPVGLVYFGCGRHGAIITIEKHFGDLGRTAIRFAAVRVALDLLADAATQFV